MKLVSFHADNAMRVGLLCGPDVVVDFTDAQVPDALVPADGHKPHRHSMARVIKHWSAVAPYLRELETAWARDTLPSLPDDVRVRDVRSLDFATPLEPPKIVAVGRNYLRHSLEADLDPPKTPRFFAKFPSTVVAHGHPILLPPSRDFIDFEAELALIIGRHARAVDVANAHDYIFGYTIVNDVTARDVPPGQDYVTLCKNHETFTPLGPVVVTADAFDYSDAGIRLELNGRVMQDDSTRSMVFDPPYLVSYLSSLMDLWPGDVITTGSPGGTGYFQDPQVCLRPGDTVSITIAGIGTLSNPVEARRFELSNNVYPFPHEPSER